MSPIKLSNDPAKALQEIASYIQSVRAGSDRAVIQDGERVGYWQTTDWLQGLAEIAGECERVACIEFERKECRGKL